MGHKIPVITVFSILIIVTAAVPLGYAIEWSPEMMLTWNEGNDGSPSIARANDGRIWVVWHSYRTGNADLLYKVYDSTKVHPWSSEKNLTTDSNADLAPAVMQAIDGKIWVVWSTNRTGNYEIYCKTTSDNGASWSQEQNLTANPKEDECPSIMQTANGTIWLVWSANRTGNFDIYYRTSQNDGATWSVDKFLNYTTTDDRDPSITQAANGKIWLVWERNVLGTEPFNIWHKTYNATSNVWSGNTAVTQDSGGIFNSHPSITGANDGKIWVVWDSDKVGMQTDVYYRIYYPDGRTFMLITQLTYNQGEDVMPSILQAVDGTMWVIWATMRTNNWDICYVTTETLLLYDVAIFSVIPTEITINEGQTVSIEIVAQNHGKNYASFIVRLYAGLTLVNESRTIGLSPGQLYKIEPSLTWTASSAGTYKIWANASVVTGEIYTVDNTFPALLGDVNSDRTVNAFDLSGFNQAYGSSLGDSNWNPNCNFDGFNGDGKVDAFDLFELSKNYGESQ